MTSSHRLIALLVIWAAAALGFVLALANSIFLPPWAVIVAVMAIATGAAFATYFITRQPPVT
ncbi:MAG: hypothetical protein JNJ61_18965 [Anaerolineae bacterium]|nr:hypothetical protein [Anaerolineae bacterium]